MKERSQRERDFLYAMCAPEAIDFDTKRIVDEVEERLFLMTWGKAAR